jgi:hypothetical protein
LRRFPSPRLSLNSLARSAGGCCLLNYYWLRIGVAAAACDWVQHSMKFLSNLEIKKEDL